MFSWLVTIPCDIDLHFVFATMLVGSIRLSIYTCKAYYDCLWFQEHYKDLKQKSFFPAMIEYITSGPVVSMV
jgi:hypothetical protein